MTFDELTRPQQAALRVLADGAEHGCWKRSTNPTAAGRGRVNTTAAVALSKLRLLSFTDWGSPTCAGSVRITAAGLDVLAAIGSP